MQELIVKVWGSNTYKRTYFNGVTCNGWNLIAPWGKPAKTCEKFEVLRAEGGYTRGDGDHAWEAEYTLTLRGENLTLKTVGRQINGSSGFTVLS